jgi:hypothetical protein
MTQMVRTIQLLTAGMLLSYMKQIQIFSSNKIGVVKWDPR